MGKDCDPELRLRLGSKQYGSSTESDSDSTRLSRATNRFENTTTQQQQPKRRQNQDRQQQQITIFHNGRTCVCDATELQARAIICMARREMEERLRERNNPYKRDSSPSPSSPLSLEPQLISPGISMKRSLQRFLQKRKTRADASSPYNYDRHPSPSP